MRISNKFIFIGLTVILIFVALYQFIKSSKPLDIGIEKTVGFVIQGNFFEGDWKDERIKNYHLIADSIAKLHGRISTAIYYNDPNEDDGFLKAFVGISAKGEELDPVFEEVRHVKSGDFIYGKISNDYFQIPQRIYLDMEEFAEEKELEIGEFSVEQYFSDTLMIVYIPIIAK